MPKPIPHPHSCPACSFTWECMNPLCEDLEQHWCRNVKGNCPDPPAHIKQARAILDAAEELLHAAWLIETHGEDLELAEDLRNVRKRVQWKAQRLMGSASTVGLPERREPAK